MISKTIKYTGILGTIVFSFGLFLAYWYAPDFYDRSNDPALSDLGVIKTSEKYFNTTLVISGSLFLIFLLKVISELKDKQKWFIKLFLLLSVLGEIGAGNFPYDSFKYPHLISAGILFTLFPFVIVLFGLELKNHKIHEKLSNYSIAAGLFAFLGVFTAYFITRKTYIGELVFILASSIWVLLVTKQLFSPKKW